MTGLPYFVAMDAHAAADAQANDLVGRLVIIAAELRHHRTEAGL